MYGNYVGMVQFSMVHVHGVMFLEIRTARTSASDIKTCSHEHYRISHYTHGVTIFTVIFSIYRPDGDVIPIYNTVISRTVSGPRGSVQIVKSEIAKTRTIFFFSNFENIVRSSSPRSIDL